MQSTTTVAKVMDEAPRRKNNARSRIGDPLFKWLTWSFTMLVLLILGGVVFTLAEGSIPVFKAMGLDFLITAKWNPVTDHYGVIVPLVGTLVTALIAMLVGVPTSFAIAFFLTELCPYFIRQPISIAIELLAAVPSIIYGIWGLFVVAPYFQSHIEPALIAVLGPVPVLGAVFAAKPIVLLFLGG